MAMINVVLGGTTVWDGEIPRVEGGTSGQMDTSALEHKSYVFENENEKTTVTEYWLDGELVHRSVHADLKTGLFSAGVTASF
jgi:hypothetical protein